MNLFDPDFIPSTNGKCYVGIDIGASGGIAIMANGSLSYKKIPQMKDKSPDLKLIWNQLSRFDKKTTHVIIESLHSIYGSSAKSNFSFGFINGAFEAFIIALELPFSAIIPKRWQKELWHGIEVVKVPAMVKKKGQPTFQERNKDGSPKYKTDTKATSLIAARRLFPGEDFLASSKSSVPHDGIVDACLLAEYGRRMNL